MILKNVWLNIKPPLEIHSDERGTIADIFYNNNINHVAIISSKAGSLRGNHYHKESTQHILITKGSLEYWYKKFGSEEKSKFATIKSGEMITTPPNEIHALKILEDNEFIVFTSGLRGGKDYENDTFRVKDPLIPNTKIKGNRLEFIS